ncbi:MAG: AtpZ/AtpI family protein [Planctomycetaceae bacterium]|nr:AtpZ/AtpI family protein [Planctomycetaceae bacterium]
MRNQERKNRTDDPTALMWAQQLSTAAIQVPLISLGGYWLDTQFGTKPWFLLLGVTLGLVSGGWSLYRTVRFFDRRDQRDPGEQDQ